MRRSKYCTKGNQIKVKLTRLGKVNPENDVIHDAQKVIWDIKKSKKFGDIATGSISAKTSGIA